MIYPSEIKKGDTIGVTAMSDGLYDERGICKEKYARENLTNMGFKIVETPDVLTGRKLVSAPAKIRANEFMSLWKRNDVPYIMIACGGEFLMETLPYIDDDIIHKSEPKWVQGFSDVSLLLFYLTTKFNIATIHSYGFSAYAMTPPHNSLLIPLEFVQNVNDIEQLGYELYEIDKDRGIGSEQNPMDLTEQVIYKSLYEKEQINIDGTLIGGCIDVLRTIIGTPYDNAKKFCDSQKKGVLWYLENCEMAVTDLKRSLWQMKMAGWFDNANGFIFGRTMADAIMGDFTYKDVLHDIFDDMNVDVVYDIDVGHTSPQWMMINGSFANFECKNGKGKISQSII